MGTKERQNCNAFRKFDQNAEWWHLPTQVCIPLYLSLYGESLGLFGDNIHRREDRNSKKRSTRFLKSHKSISDS